jgi:phage terminase small subunit
LGKRGPAPKPTAIKVLQGNPGGRPLNKAEPRPEVTIPEPPVFLDDYAKQIWSELGYELYVVKCMTNIFWPDFMVLCSAISRFKKASEILKDGWNNKIPLRNKSGEVVGEYEQQKPEVAILHKAGDEIVRVSAKFGMSPSDISGISVSGNLRDELTDFMQGRNNN